MKTRLFLFVLLFAGTVCAQAPMGTSFTYQGELMFMGTAANGEFDFQFEMYDMDEGGGSMALPVLLDNVLAVNGMFTVELDFGAAPYIGDQLWLEISVREGSSTGGYTGLLPRQKVTAVPFALHADTVAMGSIGSAQILDNSIRAVDLASNSVGISELNTAAVFEPPQNSFSGHGTVNIDTIDSIGETITSRSITLPTAGQVLAIGSCSYYTNVSSTNSRSAMYVQINTINSGSVRTGDYTYLRDYYNATGAEWHSFTIHDVFNVAAGTSTFYFRAGVQDAGDFINVYGCSLSLIFIPD